MGSGYGNQAYWDPLKQLQDIETDNNIQIYHDPLT